MKSQRGEEGEIKNQVSTKVSARNVPKWGIVGINDFVFRRLNLCVLTWLSTMVQKTTLS